MIMGSNMAENHPIAFRFVLAGQGDAARRSSTPTRASPAPRRWPTSTRRSGRGSDIAFLGGLINYILENDLWFKEYALNYTNISTIIEDEFRMPSELDGLFSGWDPDKPDYKVETWQYQRRWTCRRSLAEHYTNTSAAIRTASKAEARRTKGRRHATRRYSTRSASTRS